MIENVRKIQADVKTLQGDLRKIKSKQVWKKHVVDLARNIVDHYSHIRVQLGGARVDKQTISELDSLMQSLLEATHKQTTTSTYKSVAKRIWGGLLQLEKMALMPDTGGTGSTSIEPVDRVIINTLTQIVPSAALSYEQALLDLDSPTRLSWRGPATDLREALRECLNHLAPDKDVEAQENFKKESGAPRPTMRQKVRFVLKKRKLPEKAVRSVEDTVDLVEKSTGSFVRSVSERASVSTHTPTKKPEVNRVRDFVRLALCELLSIPSE